MLPKQDILKSQPQNLRKWPYLQILIPSFFTLFLYLFKTNLPCHPLIATFSSSLISSSSNSPIPILSSYFFFLTHLPLPYSYILGLSSVFFFPTVLSPGIFSLSVATLTTFMFVCLVFSFPWARFQLSNTHFLNQLHSWLFCELFATAFISRLQSSHQKSLPFVSIPWTPQA